MERALEYFLDKIVHLSYKTLTLANLKMEIIHFVDKLVEQIVFRFRDSGLRIFSMKISPIKISPKKKLSAYQKSFKTYLETSFKTNLKTTIIKKILILSSTP